MKTKDVDWNVEELSLTEGEQKEEEKQDVEWAHLNIFRMSATMRTKMKFHRVRCTQGLRSYEKYISDYFYEVSASVTAQGCKRRALENRKEAIQGGIHETKRRSEGHLEGSLSLSSTSSESAGGQELADRR